MRNTPRIACAIGRRLHLGLLAIGMTFGIAAPARAQGFISPLIGADFGGDAQCPNLTGCQDKKINASVSVGAMGELLGFEEEVAYAPNFFGNATGLSSSVLTVMSNVMLVPKVGPVRPYVEGGIGLINTRVDLTTTSVFTTDKNGFGWDVGAGVIGFFGGSCRTARRPSLLPRLSGPHRPGIHAEQLKD